MKKLSKKIIVVIIIAIVIGGLILFIKNSNNTYKISNMGNNKENKTLDDVEDYILNINYYEAEIEVTINSNKNSNKYKIKQILNKDEEIQEMLEPANLSGVTISYKGGNLEVKNTALNLVKLYNNYPYITDNNLWLNSFVESYKDSENKEIEENEEEFIITLTSNKTENNIKYKKLYINKKDEKPTKMSLMDDSKNTIIYILYNEITLN